MALVVCKFGGTSVATPKRIINVAKRLVAKHEAGDQLVVVVSAMGKTTDDLMKLALAVNDSPPPREIDMLLSTGEQVSMSILAMAIDALGHQSVSLTGGQVGIVTDSLHRKAKIREIKPARIRKELDEGKIVIVAGFQGITRAGDITTLGRGGSDTTAVAIAAGIKADKCEIYSDVDGVYTTDPRVVPCAKKLAVISYDEMLELAASGAGVLQMRAVEFARHFGVVIECRSAFTDEPGTIIKEVTDPMESAVISGIAFDKSEAKITIRDVPDRVGVAAQVFGTIAEVASNVDMIVQNISEDHYTDLTFTTPMQDLPRLKPVLEQLIHELGAREYLIDDSVVKISLIGAGMKTNPGIAAKMFQVLAEHDVNISLITTSSIRISVVIEGEDIQRVVKCLHTAFGLDSDKVFEETQLSAEEMKAKMEKGR